MHSSTAKARDTRQTTVGPDAGIQRDPEDAAVASAEDPSWAATQMAATDRTKHFLGITIRELDRGRAVLTMSVRPEMANGFEITHGGIVFSLADTAFAYACNEGAQPTVASGADITFAKASVVGDTLTATAMRRWTSGRNGLYDVTVTNQHGDTIAEFRGRSFTTNRPLPHLSSSDPAAAAAAVPPSAPTP